VITRLREKGYLPTFNKRVEITTRELIAPKFLQTDCKSALREIVNMSDQVKLGRTADDARKHSRVRSPVGNKYHDEGFATGK